MHGACSELTLPKPARSTKFNVTGTLKTEDSIFAFRKLAIYANLAYSATTEIGSGQSTDTTIYRP